MHPIRRSRACAERGSARSADRLDRRAGLLAGDAERAAAATGRDDVRVLDLEAGAGQRVDVVDLRAVDVLERSRARPAASCRGSRTPGRRRAARRRRAGTGSPSSRRRERRRAGRRPPTSAPCASRYSRAFAAPLSVIVTIASKSIAPSSACSKLFGQCPMRRDIKSRIEAAHPRRPRRGRGLDRRRRPFPRDGRLAGVRRPVAHPAAPPRLRRLRRRDRWPDPCPVIDDAQPVRNP